MKIIERTIDKDIRISSNLVNKKLCLLDIETTGLSRSKDSIYLIGLAFYDDLEIENSPTPCRRAS